jgi:hypothetical protein
MTVLALKNNLEIADVFHTKLYARTGLVDIGVKGEVTTSAPSETAECTAGFSVA